MGGITKIILVSFCALLSVLIFWCFQGQSPANKTTVITSDYQDFWLWPGNKISDNISSINNLYLLQGEFLANSVANEIRLSGISPSRLAAQQLWLVFRVEKVVWDAGIASAVNRRIAIWEHYGNRVAGIQIDFDAKSAALADYATLLRQVRQQLPVNYQLSVTGLLDWSNGAYDAGLQDISQTVDEVVFQTYQGRRTIPEYARYLQRLSQLDIAFKIGLVEHGDWQPSARALKTLRNNHKFFGFVVFLSKPAAPAQ